MAGREGGDRRVDPEGRPALADGREIRDRDGQERRLGVLRPIEEVGGPGGGKLADRFAEGGAGGGEDGGGGRGRGGESLSHADRLRALAGEHEGRRGHPPQRTGRNHAHTGWRVRECTDLPGSGYPRAQARVRDPVAPRCPSVTVDSRSPGRRVGPPPPARTIARRFEADLSATVLAAGTRISNVRQISERVAMGRALWRELVIGFASQLGELRLGFTQLAALYVLADSGTMTIGDLPEVINRSPSATSRLVDGLVQRRLVERRVEEEDRRQRTLQLTPPAAALLPVVDLARPDQV